MRRGIGSNLLAVELWPCPRPERHAAIQRSSHGASRISPSVKPFQKQDFNLQERSQVEEGNPMPPQGKHRKREKEERQQEKQCKAIPPSQGAKDCPLLDMPQGAPPKRKRRLRKATKGRASGAFMGEFTATKASPSHQCHGSRLFGARAWTQASRPDFGTIEHQQCNVDCRPHGRKFREASRKRAGATI